MVLMVEIFIRISLIKLTVDWYIKMSKLPVMLVIALGNNKNCHRYLLLPLIKIEGVSQADHDPDFVHIHTIIHLYAPTSTKD